MHNLEKYEGEAQQISLSSYYLESFKNKEVKRYYKMYSKRTKQTPNDQTFKLVHVKIYLHPKDIKNKHLYSYNYTIVLYISDPHPIYFDLLNKLVFYFCR